MSGESVGVLVLAAVAIIIVWMWIRARRGYRNIQALMARVDASANSEASAVAGASNHVHVAVGTTDDGERIHLSEQERTVIAHLRRGAIDTGPEWDRRADEFLRGDLPALEHHHYDDDDHRAADHDDDYHYNAAEHSLSNIARFRALRNTGPESSQRSVVSRDGSVWAGRDSGPSNGRAVNL